MGVELLFLNDAAMRRSGVADMRAAMRDVERVYALYARGEVINPGKCVLRWGRTAEDEKRLGRINAMPGYVGGEYDMAGIKWIGSGPMNYRKGLPRASVTIILNDPDTKLPLAVIDGTQISTMRTGASGGIAIRLLARADARTMTICGAGAQAPTQLEAALIARPSIERLFIYDIRAENAERFARAAREKYPGLAVAVAPDVEAAARESDIIDCVTLAAEPFIRGEWLKAGSLVMNMADYEVDNACVLRAGKRVVDYWDNVKHRMISAIALMWRDGLFRDDELHAEIGQIVCGDRPGREDDDEIIYFNAVGAGIMDIAVATRCYRAAQQAGLGMVLPYWE